jgi:hypothetical protein
MNSGFVYDKVRLNGLRLPRHYAKDLSTKFGVSEKYIRNVRHGNTRDYKVALEIYRMSEAYEREIIPFENQIKRIDTEIVNMKTRQYSIPF